MLKSSLITHVVLFEELLRVVVAVDVDLGKGVEDGGILTACLNTGLQPRENELEAIASFDFMYKFVDSEVTGDRRQQALDCRLVAVDVE